MTGGLPPGLILVEDNPTHEIEAENEVEPRLDITTIAKTWRIYSISRNVLVADTGTRLENLFWRTWSNPYLLRTLHPSSFTNVVHYVGSGRGSVQPAQPSYSSTDLGPQEEHDITAVASGSSTAIASPIQTSSNPASSVAPPLECRQSSNASAKSPHSILKKSLTDHSYVDSSVEDASTPASQNPKRGSMEASGSSADVTSPASSERPRMKRSTSGNSKKASFVANHSARAKARPSVPRRKSSQGTVPQSKDKQKEPLKSPVKSSIKISQPLQTSPSGEAFPQLPVTNPVHRKPTNSPLSPDLSPNTKSAVFLLPSASSWQSVESTSPSRSGQESVMQSSMSLVDVDFRKQFVEARSASQINLAASSLKMRKAGSVVRFADGLHDGGKGKARESSMTLGRRDSGAGARPSSLSRDIPTADDTDGDDNGDEGLSMLSRTRSQLSMAIEERRRLSGSANLDTDPDKSFTRTGGREGGKANNTNIEKEDTEDELLKMGRGDGVTKAGGPRSRQRLSTNPPSHQRYRSPTPPPIF